MPLWAVIIGCLVLLGAFGLAWDIRCERQRRTDVEAQRKRYEDDNLHEDDNLQRPSATMNDEAIDDYDDYF